MLCLACLFSQYINGLKLKSKFYSTCQKNLKLLFVPRSLFTRWFFDISIQNSLETPLQERVRKHGASSDLFLELVDAIPCHLTLPRDDQDFRHQRILLKAIISVNDLFQAQKDFSSSEQIIAYDSAESKNTFNTANHDTPRKRVFISNEKSSDTKVQKSSHSYTHGNFKNYHAWNVFDYFNTCHAKLSTFWFKNAMEILSKVTSLESEIYDTDAKIVIESSQKILDMLPLLAIPINEDQVPQHETIYNGYIEITGRVFKNNGVTKTYCNNNFFNTIKKQDRSLRCFLRLMRRAVTIDFMGDIILNVCAKVETLYMKYYALHTKQCYHSGGFVSIKVSSYEDVLSDSQLIDQIQNKTTQPKTYTFYLKSIFDLDVSVEISVDSVVLNKLYQLYQGDCFVHHVSCLLCQYNVVTLLEAKSFHAAIPPVLWSMIQNQLHVKYECFASPFNNTLPSYYSMYPSIDQFFGSLGSFFEKKFSLGPGSYQVNPPFTDAVLSQVLQIIYVWLYFSEKSEEQLTNTTNITEELKSLLNMTYINSDEVETFKKLIKGCALSFFVVLPYWEQEDCRFLTILKDLQKYCRSKVLVPENQHKYIAPEKLHCYQKSYFSEPVCFTSGCSTLLCIFQNHLGTQEWPFHCKFLSELRQTWISG